MNFVRLEEDMIRFGNRVYPILGPRPRCFRSASTAKQGSAQLLRVSAGGLVFIPREDMQRSQKSKRFLWFHASKASKHNRFIWISPLVYMSLRSVQSMLNSRDFIFPLFRLLCYLWLWKSVSSSQVLYRRQFEEIRR
jgi:hypothetical protein